jgi:hypothetical protein
VCPAGAYLGRSDVLKRFARHHLTLVTSYVMFLEDLEPWSGFRSQGMVPSLR